MMNMGLKSSCLGAIIITVLISMMIMPTFLHALTAPEIVELRAKYGLSSLLVFGDSSVDPGNNNRLTAIMKCNFPPYGMDFIGGRPTGRFSNGKLATDYLAEAVGYGNIVPGFLDPNITKEDMLHAKGVKVIESELNMKTLYIDDAYESLNSVINNPKKYGFSETRKGCCGSGTFETGDTCRGAETCKDPDQYVFWDSVHCTQMMYKILANEIVKSFPLDFFS